MFFITDFDCPDCKSPIAIIHTRPDKGYASVSTSCISFLGFGDDWKPLESCDMHSDIDYSHHLAISDVKGKSVVVEWVDK